MAIRYSYQPIFRLIIYLHLFVAISGLLVGLFTTFSLTDCHIKSVQASEDGTRHRFMITSLPGMAPSVYLDPKLQFTSVLIFYVFDVLDILLTVLMLQATSERNLESVSKWVWLSTMFMFGELIPLPFLFHYFTEMVIFWIHVAVYPFYGISVLFVNSYRNHIKNQNRKWERAVTMLEHEPECDSRRGIQRSTSMYL